MIDWPKLQPLYERKAYRIVQKHVKKILQGIPLSSVSQRTWEQTIAANITEDQIKKMFIEIYSTIGINYGNRINKEIERTKNAHILFNEYLLNEILLFLSNEGGAKIVSVHNTLIEEVIKAVKAQLGENATVIEIQNAIFNIVSKSQTFYKWQALRIARTETTFASGFVAMKTAENSNLAMTKTWISAVDNRTRHDHLQENGQSVDFEDDFTMASGVKMGYPGDPKAPANEVINCRCTIGFTPKRDANGDLIMRTGAGKQPLPNSLSLPNSLNIKATGFDNLSFDAKEFAINKAKEYGVTGEISMVNNPKSKNLGGATGWSKDADGNYGSNNKIDVYGKLTDDQIKEVISHEMRHIMQMQTKQFEFKGGFYYWNGQKIISADTYKKYVRGMSSARSQDKRSFYYKKYKETPWEADAHAHGDPFDMKKDIAETQPADIITPAEWNKDIPINELTMLDLEVLNLQD